MPTPAEKNADMKFPASELPRGEVLENTCVVDLFAKPFLQLVSGDIERNIISLLSVWSIVLYGAWNWTGLTP